MYTSVLILILRFIHYVEEVALLLNTWLRWVLRTLISYQTRESRTGLEHDTCDNNNVINISIRII